MSDHFSRSEWNQVFARLDANEALYDLPQRDDSSIVFGSWNIRKFGSILDKAGNPSRTSGATQLISRFCTRCDFLAIQEVLADLGSVRQLVDAMNADSGRDYRMLTSDVTGAVPGGKGMKERLVYIFDANKIELSDLASDLSIDQTAVLANVNRSLKKSHQNMVDEAANTGENVSNWVGAQWLATKLFVKGKLNSFITFIRSPHLATFRVYGEGGNEYYLSIVNAHLQYGRGKEREREFFSLLEWLIRSTASRVDMEPAITILMADLNLDFESSNDNRRHAAGKTIADLNRNKTRAKQLKVNFPFLDDHPSKGRLRTNARRSETFDHISTFKRQDERFPLARFNSSAGSQGTSGFDYGMFNFVSLFNDAGPGLTGGVATVERYQFDVSDHMPIYLRMPLPRAGQRTYSETNGISD